MLLDKFPAPQDKGSGINSSWLRGSVLKLKRCIPSREEGAALARATVSHRSPSPSRRAFEVGQASSRSAFSHDVFKRSASVDLGRIASHRGPSTTPTRLSSHEHTGFQRKEHVQEERRGRRVGAAAAREVASSTCGSSKAADMAELVSERLQACAAVRTPRIPGGYSSGSKPRDKVVEREEVVDTFCKRGLLMKVPDYLTKLTGASREGVRAVPHLRPPDYGAGRKSNVPHAIRKTKSGTVASATVPISAKQWLLQAIGLKDTEIREMFIQMESIPQLAGEHVREIRAEWEAMEARVNRVPPEAGFLVKDRLLLEKVRELIIRFVECTNPVVSPIPGDQGTELSKNVDEVEGSKHEDVSAKDAEPAAPAAAAHLTEVDNEPVAVEKQAKDDPPQDQQQSLEPHKSAAPPPSSLPSYIPVEDYVVNKYVVQPELLGRPDCKFTYSPFDKRWYTVVFPALQPGKREDVQLLGDWLQHAMQKNHCEKVDGRFENVEAAFVLHSIAFLEIVRQVDIHCEERGNLLLHLWRQLLRIFNQVLVRAEPKLNATEDEMKRLRDDLEGAKDHLSRMLSDHDFYRDQYDVIRAKLKDKDIEMRKIKRCRLCRTENMSPRSRNEYLVNLKKRSISFRYTHEPTEEELKQQEEELKKQLELKRQEEERKKLEAGGATAEGAQTEGAEAGKKAGADESTEQLTEEELQQLEEGEKQQTAVPVSETNRRDDYTQTDPSKGLRRCQSAPPNIFPPKKIVEAKEKGGEEVEKEVKAEAEGAGAEAEAGGAAPQAELSADDLKALAGGWVDPEAAGKDKAEGPPIVERLKEFETLAVDTIGLLDRLPMEGALAEKIEVLLKKYCEMTGTVLGDKFREKFMQRHKSLMQGKRGSVAVEGAKVSFIEGGPSSGRPSEMRKSRKSKGSKFGSQLKSYVPLGFAKMMKIYNPPKTVKFFNVRQLTKLIASVYVSKIVADSVDDSCNNERQTCCEFVYDFMLNQYGLKGLSESAIFGVFKTVKTLITNKEIEKHHKIRVFSRFVGMDETNNYSEPDLYLYLKILQRASSKTGVLLPSDQDDGLIFLNASQYAFIADEPNLVAYFGSQGAALSFVEKYVAKNAVTEKASPEIRKLVKESEVRKVDWDLLVEAILAVYPHKMDTIQDERRKSIQVSKPVPKDKATELENLFIAGDANQDGVLTFSEFREIVTTADSSISQQSAIRMFRETLLMMPDGGDSISPQAFAQIAYNHGIEAPASTVFDLLKKTWSQVQDDIDPEKVNASKDEYDFSKEVLQDLMQQKVDVNSAVQTFRQFVLRFCGQDEEEQPASQQMQEGDEEALLQEEGCTGEDMCRVYGAGLSLHKDGLEGLTVAEWAQLTPGLPPTVNVSTDAGKGLVAKYTALSGEVKELEAQVRDARDQKLSLQAEVKDTREQKLSLQAEVKDAKEKKLHAEGLLAAMQDEVMDRMAKLEAETKNGKAELEKQLEQCNAKLEQLQLANADLHKAMAELRELNKKHQERIFELEFLVYHEHK
ncbi:hypothetical protein SELMODRAFT_424073 [Selaginella moellendorffii]|uniref:EF-hand domain-containing protein n=1 Tax=Selaginella moellendorffii TaxID=88036 RepID=D8SNQ4_SELML|nr:hypothetical protein SELMODRAFT_424073 [Selaginella moellendorffii]